MRKIWQRKPREGGSLPEGMSLVHNDTTEPEVVIVPEDSNRCTKITRKGTRCTFPALERGLCAVHLGMEGSL